MKEKQELDGAQKKECKTPRFGILLFQSGKVKIHVEVKSILIHMCKKWLITYQRVCLEQALEGIFGSLIHAF